MNKHELYYEVAFRHLQEQDSRNQQMEFKASATLGFAATLVGIAGLTIQDKGTSSLVLALIMLVAFVIAALCSMAVLRVARWQRRPNLKELATHLKSYHDTGLTEWVGDAFAASIDDNERVLQNKADWLELAMLSIAAEGIALGALFLISYF